MIFVAIPAILLILVVLLDVFEVVILPRRVGRRLRLARWAFRTSWLAWSSAGSRFHDGERRETLLSFFGPLFLLLLLIMWAVLLVLAFALLHFALGSSIISSGGNATFWTDLYLSGTTFFTLGLGDVVPNGGAARSATVVEAGLGFGFLALVIGYLPTFYQTFSRREAIIALLDARAGSPPTAGALLRRYGYDDTGRLRAFLADFERWSAELLESHLSYPIVGSFRSQHERQSWVAALTAILDFSAFLVVSGKSGESEAAELTFAIARHAAVDLSQVYQRRPEMPDTERLTRDDFDRLVVVLGHETTETAKLDRAFDELAALRATYEPFVAAMSEYLLMPLPTWVPEAHAVADWESSPTDPEESGLADPIRSKLPWH